jgi:hypothetical protein
VRVSNSRVLLDVMRCITGKHNIYEQLEILCTVTAKDNVYLTAQGYKALAQGLVKEAASFSESKQKVKQVGRGVRGCYAEWLGFSAASVLAKTAKTPSKNQLWGEAPPLQTSKGRVAAVISISPSPTLSKIFYPPLVLFIFPYFVCLFSSHFVYLNNLRYLLQQILLLVVFCHSKI